MSSADRDADRALGALHAALVDWIAHRSVAAIARGASAAEMRERVLAPLDAVVTRLRAVPPASTPCTQAERLIGAVNAAMAAHGATRQGEP